MQNNSSDSFLNHYVVFATQTSDGMLHYTYDGFPPRHSFLDVYDYYGSFCLGYSEQCAADGIQLDLYFSLISAWYHDCVCSVFYSAFTPLLYDQCAIVESDALEYAARFSAALRDGAQ